jgi:hypothetical protein
MQRQTVICGPDPKVRLHSVPGDLRVSGWERDEISARTNGDMLQLTGNERGFDLSCDDDLILFIPLEAELTIESVGGDVDLRGFNGVCQVEQVGGDLSGRNLGSFQAGNVGGNLSLRGAAGDIAATRVGGDVSLRAAQADISLPGVGGDLHLRGASGNLSASVGGDAVLYLEPRPDADVMLTAGGDILLRLSPDADVRLELQGGGSDSIHVNLPGVAFEEQTWSGGITLGEGRAHIHLVAGGEITVTSQVEEWQSAAEFDFDLDVDFPNLPADFSGQIEREVEYATRQARRAQQHAEVAMQRAQQKAREAERRIQAKVNARVGRWGMDWSGAIPRPPRPPAPPLEPVSDEERLTILRMLAEKKITAEEAEKLLAALEE